MAKHKRYDTTAHAIEHTHVTEKTEDSGTIKISKQTLKTYGMILVGILVLAVAIFAFIKFVPHGTGGGPATFTPAPGAAKVDFYVMSKCPYGVQVENAIKPVLDSMGDKVDFNLNFIASDGGDGTFQSLHGETEVQGDIVNLCAAKYEPSKYMDMIVCMNKDSANIPTNWQSCAQAAGMDTTKINACFIGPEGKQLLATSIKAAEAVKATGSPTIYINGKAYESGRDPASFTRVICASTPSLATAAECKDLPACTANTDCPAQAGKIATCESAGTKDAKCAYKDDAKVELVVVNDKACTSCDPARIVSISQQLFPAVSVRYVDVSSAEGKQLVSQLKLTYVPAYVFDSKITETNSWINNVQLRGSFETLGDKYKISDSATGASHYVSAEMQQKALAAMGVTIGDNKPQIDFFVMAYCPYGNQAEEAIEPAYQLLKGKADFNPRYVIYSNYQGGGADYCMESGKYCSMHGIQELHQNIRELCVAKNDGMDAYFKFALAMNAKCTAQNADTCWSDVAKGLSLDTAKITKCQQDQGVALLKAEQDLDTVYGVSGSPSVFIDGEAYSGARTAEGFKTGLCAAFTTQPSQCSTQLAGAATATQQAAASPSGACG